MNAAQIAQGVLIALFAAIFGAIANSSWASLSSKDVSFSYLQLEAPISSLGFNVQNSDAPSLTRSRNPVIVRLEVYNPRNTRIIDAYISDLQESFAYVVRCADPFCTKPSQISKNGSNFNIGSIEPNTQTYIYLSINAYLPSRDYPPVILVADGSLAHGYFSIYYLQNAFGLLNFTLNNQFVTFLIFLFAAVCFCNISVDFILRRVRRRKSDKELNV